MCIRDRATALALAAEGVHLALTARRRPELTETAAAAAACGVRTIILPADMANRAEAEGVVHAAIAQLGRLDIVVTCAGIYVRGPIATLTAADFEQCMAVNFFGTVYPVLAALPHLCHQQSGHIVLLSSVDGKKAIRTDAPYAATKFAIAGFGEALRQDLHGTGVDVSIIFPGRVATPLIAGMKIPWISRPIPPERVARAIVRAIRCRRAEVILPATAWALLLADWLSPRLGDWAVRTFHLEGLEEKER
ncbi:MAG: SDR family NAD(P)-dependent oxidoreductase, partial [Anaerolineae bacterium]|nr:SDR family NAD(P)-dependent oxidoreductase [Anaerolineae bacterium]